MRRLMLLLMLLIPRLALAQYPSPIFNTVTVNGALSATGGGTLGGNYGGTPTMSALWTFNGGLTGSFTGGTINGTPIGATSPNVGNFTNSTFGAGSSQTLNINGQALTTGGSSTQPLYITLNPTTQQLLEIQGTNTSGAKTTIMDINGSTASSVNFYSQINLSSSQAPAHYDIFSNKNISGLAGDSWGPILLQYSDSMTSNGTNNLGIMGINDYLTAGWNNSRVVFAVKVQQIATSGTTAGIGSLATAIGSQCIISANQNGTNANWGGVGAGMGGCFATNPVVGLSPNATWIHGIVGEEIDVGVAQGASTNIRIGFSVVDTSTATTGSQGAWIDEAVALGSARPLSSGLGWKRGIAFGDPQGYFPIDPAGTMIVAGPVSGSVINAANGIDFSLATFSGSAFKSPGFAVDGSGNVTSAGIASTKTVTGSGFLTPNTVYDLATVGGNIRNTYLQTTLAPSVATTNIWENANSFVYVNGPGAANGEINVIHAFLQVNPGASVGTAEGFESSMANNGTLGGFTDYLAAATNGATSNTNTMQGFVYIPQNLNTTAGSVVISAALDVEPMIGGGAQPTYSYAMRVRDTHASIATVSNAVIGSISPQPLNQMLTIFGPDTLGNTFPLTIKNTSGNIFVVTDSGVTSVGQVLQVGLGMANTFEFDATSAGTTPGIKMLGGDANVGLNFILAGTGVLQANGVPGVTCSGAPTASYASTRGLVTHC